MSSTNPLPDFTLLNPSVYIYSPSSSTTTKNSSDPSLILLVTWFNASPRHIAKYTQGYQNLFPTSRILIVRTDTYDLIGFYSSNLGRLGPALDVLATVPQDQKILLSLFSNGGACATNIIAEEFLRQTGRQLPVPKMVLDSAPGIPTLQSAIRAMSVSLPKNFFLRGLGICMIYTVLGSMALWYGVSGQDDQVVKARRALNDERLWGTAQAKLYIYSEADDMVDWTDVEDHAVKAEKNGYPVTLEKYVHTGHVGHVMGDGSRYWGAVQKLWNTWES